MSSSCLALNNTFCPNLQASAGASDTAKSIEKEFENFRHDAGPGLKLLHLDIAQMVAEAGAAPTADLVPIDIDTAAAAIAFINLLPRSLPVPEVAPDPDGDISFDWMASSGKMFSVSVDAYGRLAYAGRFGENSKVHGTEQLSEICPQEIIRGIAKAIS